MVAKDVSMLCVILNYSVLCLQTTSSIRHLLSCLTVVASTELENPPFVDAFLSKEGGSSCYLSSPEGIKTQTCGKKGHRSCGSLMTQTTCSQTPKCNMIF